MALLLVAAGTVAAQQSRFSSSQETGGAPGRYRVELELRPGDDLAAVSNQLVATYGARIETYAEEGFSGFAIIATPTRARLMSSDPRVVAITDLNPAVNTDSPRGTQPSEAAVATKVAPPTVAVEQGRGIATETVPGFGNYVYDPSGNITSIDTQAFRYDPFGRLQTADLGSFGTKAYTYDRYGNILKVVTDGDEVNAARMSVDPETNQIDLPFSGSNPANMIATYDGVGNVVVHQGSYLYDALNMMKETTDTTRRLHIYSASDERVIVVQVQSGLETTSEWTLRDGSERVLRRLMKDSSGVWHWKEDYIYGGTRLLAAEVPGSERVRHFHADHLGTPRLITGNGGARLAEKTYQPFGLKVSPPTDDFEQLEFTGHERDLPSLDYMHARYYRPDLGRFLSVDPGQDWNAHAPQSWNRYAYARNNPVTNVDPDGRYVAVANDLRRDISRTYANSATFRRAYDAIHRDRSIVQKLHLTMTRRRSNRAETTEDSTSRGAMIVNGQVTRDANGNVVPALRLTTLLPPGSIGATAGHELHHGTEYLAYGSPANAPDARQSQSGEGNVETQSALDVERQIKTELQQSGMRNTLTPAEQQNLFDVPAGCISNVALCPKLEPIIDSGASTLPRPPG